MRIYFAGHGYRFSRERKYFAELPEYKRLVTMMYEYRCRKILAFSHELVDDGAQAPKPLAHKRKPKKRRRHEGK